MTPILAPMQLSVRARITAAFAAVMLMLFAGIAALAYKQISAALLDELDTALRFRAVTALAQPPLDHVLHPDLRLQEPTEAFEQVVSDDGTISSATAGFAVPVLTAADLRRIHSPMFLTRAVHGVEGSARLLAVPTEISGRRVLLVVGAAMTDRSDALHDLATVVLVGGPISVTMACIAAWLVAGWVLRPMERLRVQAAAITASGTDRRLNVPRNRDEIGRLALTLNDMLERLARSMAGERAFLEHAGHELRTPLAALRAEIDLALHRNRSANELRAALRSVSDETDRLARLAEDLLVLARAADGRLPLHREPVPLRGLLDSLAARFAAQAQAGGVTISVRASGNMLADQLRLRQVLTNLVANALRHAPHGGHITLSADATPEAAWISVHDDGPGFETTAINATGLGLHLVRAITVAHGGRVDIGRGSEGGAVVTVTVPNPQS